jgi:hypothetical protein
VLSSLKKLDTVAELPEGCVTVGTQETADGSRLVVVIDRKGSPANRLRELTDGAKTVLLFEHLLIISPFEAVADAKV